MNSEPATKEDIKSISELIRYVLDKVSTLERSLYERLDILKAKSLDLEQQKQALTKKVNQLEKEVIDLRKANVNLSVDSERRSKEDNLLFHGLKSEEPKETASQTAALVTKFLNENLL